MKSDCDLRCRETDKFACLHSTKFCHVFADSLTDNLSVLSMFWRQDFSAFTLLGYASRGCTVGRNTCKMLRLYPNWLGNQTMGYIIYTNFASLKRIIRSYSEHRTAKRCVLHFVASSADIYYRRSRLTIEFILYKVALHFVFVLYFV